MKLKDKITSKIPFLKKWNDAKYDYEPYEDGFSKSIPFVSVILFTALMVYLAYDSWVVVRP